MRTATKGHVHMKQKHHLAQKRLNKSFNLAAFLNDRRI